MNIKVIGVIGGFVVVSAAGLTMLKHSNSQRPAAAAPAIDAMAPPASEQEAPAISADSQAPVDLGTSDMSLNASQATDAVSADEIAQPGIPPSGGILPPAETLSSGAGPQGTMPPVAAAPAPDSAMSAPQVEAPDQAAQAAQATQAAQAVSSTETAPAAPTIAPKVRAVMRLTGAKPGDTVITPQHVEEAATVRGRNDPTAPTPGYATEIYRFAVGQSPGGVTLTAYYTGRTPKVGAYSKPDGKTAVVDLFNTHFATKLPSNVPQLSHTYTVHGADRQRLVLVSAERSAPTVRVSKDKISVSFATGGPRLAGWHIRAMDANVAFLSGANGQWVTANVGTVLGGFGKVTAILPDAQRVITESGVIER